MAEILVLGAGMIGVSTALAFQERGHSVALVDRRAPGQEASYGNAGYITSDTADPTALPRQLGKLLRYGLGLSNDVTYDLGAALRMAPALWTYFKYSRPDRLREQAVTYAEMSRRATAAQAPWIEAAGAGNLISKSGYYEVWRNPRQTASMDAEAREVRQRYGMSPEVLTGAQLSARETAIHGNVAGAVFWPETWLCADPGGLVQAYADLFVARGGQMLKGDATSLAQAASGWKVTTDEGQVTAEHAVLALGAWTPAVLAGFGYRVPMIYKRGYHAHFDAPKGLSASIMDLDNGVVLTGMTRGLRLATGAALVAMDAPPDTRQITRGARAVSDIIALGPRIQEPQWFGTRPFMPDMLPVVGAAPKHKGLWCHFGHGHLGFTLGPASAHLLTEAFDGADTPILRAISPARRTALGQG